MKLSEEMEKAAVSYVADTDYISDGNRKIAGFAFYDGAMFGFLKAAEKLRKEADAHPGASEQHAVGHSVARWLESVFESGSAND